MSVLGAILRTIWALQPGIVQYLHFKNAAVTLLITSCCKAVCGFLKFEQASLVATAGIVNLRQRNPRVLHPVSYRNYTAIKDWTK